MPQINCENEKQIRKDERIKVLDEVLKLPKNREQPNGAMYIFVEKIKRLRNPECNTCCNVGARCPGDPNCVDYGHRRFQPDTDKKCDWKWDNCNIRFSCENGEDCWFESESYKKGEP